MNTRQCLSCGAREGVRHFSGRSITMSLNGTERRVDDLSLWECQQCGEVVFDDDDSSQRHGIACEELVIAGRQMIGAEMRQIRRKLNLSQKEAVLLLSGGGHNAFSRYERGEVLPPKALILLMRLLDRHPHLLTDVKILADGADFKGFKHTMHKEHETLSTS